jgi:hypothetical protein
MKENGFGNLGFYTLGLMFFFLGVFSFLAAPIIQCLGEKGAFSISTLCYGIATATFLIPLYKSQYPENEFLQNFGRILTLVTQLLACPILGFG